MAIIAMVPKRDHFARVILFGFFVE